MTTILLSFSVRNRCQKTFPDAKSGVSIALIHWAMDRQYFSFLGRLRDRFIERKPVFRFDIGGLDTH
jgi:hypothetical protein